MANATIRFNISGLSEVRRGFQKVATNIHRIKAKNVAELLRARGIIATAIPIGSSWSITVRMHVFPYPIAGWMHVSDTFIVDTIARDERIRASTVVEMQSILRSVDEHSRRLGIEYRKLGKRPPRWVRWQKHTKSVLREVARTHYRIGIDAAREQQTFIADRCVDNLPIVRICNLAQSEGFKAESLRVMHMQLRSWNDSVR